MLIKLFFETFLYTFASYIALAVKGLGRRWKFTKVISLIYKYNSVYQ